MMETKTFPASQMFRQANNTDKIFWVNAEILVSL